MKRLWQRIVIDHFVLFVVLISFFSLYETAVAGENQLLDDERLRSLEERIGGLTTEVEKLNKNKSLTPEQQEYIRESISDAIKDLKLDEQAIRIYSAKADISNILQEYFVWILTTMLAALGAFGLGAYRLLKDRIERRAKQLAEELKREATEQKNVIVTRILSIVGYTHWKLYEAEKNDADLRLAIASTRRALEYTGRIQDKEEYEREIADAKNNLVYYLLEKEELKDSEKSTIWEYAEDILKISRKEKHQGGKDWYDWRDTYVWVLLKLEPGSDEQEEGKEMFQELIGHKGIPRKWRKETLRRYREDFDWVAQKYPVENE